MKRTEKIQWIAVNDVPRYLLAVQCHLNWPIRGPPVAASQRHLMSYLKAEVSTEQLMNADTQSSFNLVTHLFALLLKLFLTPSHTVPLFLSPSSLQAARWVDEFSLMEMNGIPVSLLSVKWNVSIVTVKTVDISAGEHGALDYHAHVKSSPMINVALDVHSFTLSRF